MTGETPKIHIFDNPDDVIDKDVWLEALGYMRYYPGMGACHLRRNPYTHNWKFQIDFSDSTTFIGENPNVNQAIKSCVSKMQENPPNHLWNPK